MSRGELEVQLIKLNVYQDRSFMVENKILMRYLKDEHLSPYLLTFNASKVGPKLRVIKCD